jgi:acetylornithine deacetylase
MSDEAAPAPNPRTLEILGELLATRTPTNTPNLEAIEYIEGVLRPLGAEMHRSYDETGTKANLLARLGPDTGPGLMLSGHTDVVPVEGQSWRTDPWAFTREGERIYGRGACDMKGYLACMLSLAERLDPTGLPGPLFLAFSYDEEVGTRGVLGLISQFTELGYSAELCVVGEPTRMRVGVGHKSILQGTCTVTGSEAHSSLEPQAANALYAAARLIAKLEEMELAREHEGPFEEGYGVPHSTVQAAVIEAGVALNIVPRTASFGFEFRCIPGEDPHELLEEFRSYGEREVLPALRRRAGDAAIDWSIDIEGPGLDMPADHPGVRRMLAAAGEAEVSRMPYATEAGRFQLAGIPAVLCGPGNIEQAHKPDEYITIDQLARCEHVLERLLGATTSGRNR